jgi:transposase
MQSMPAHKKYPDELRERAIRLAMDQIEEGSGQAVFRRVGEQLGINPETLRGWVKQAQIEAGQHPGTTTSEAQRLQELEAENLKLRTVSCVGRTRWRIQAVSARNSASFSDGVR